MRRLALFIFPAMLAACLSTTDTSVRLDPTDTNVAGLFSLTLINGAPLPVLATVTSTQEFDLASDTVSITTDGAWTETTVYTVTSLTTDSTSTTVTVISGTYSIANQQINFVQTSPGSGNGQAFAGSVKGSQLTIVYGGSQFLYARSS